MEELGKKIRDIQDKIKQKRSTLCGIEGLPTPTDELLNETRANLCLAEERGILYLKRSVADSLLTFIRNSRKALPDKKQFTAQRNAVCGILFAVYIQRLISMGNTETPVDMPGPEPQAAQDATKHTLVSVIKEVDELVKNDKNAFKTPEIRNILYLIDEMKKARKSFHQITTLTRDAVKKEVYKKNYQRIAGNLESRIKTTYRAYKSGTGGNNVNGVSLDAIPLKKLGPVLNVQLEVLIKFYMTLDFAAQEGRTCTNILLPLAIDIKNMVELIDKEEVIYRSFFSESHHDSGTIKAMARRVSISFSSMIPYHLERVTGTRNES
jgi:hypothetical protein